MQGYTFVKGEHYPVEHLVFETAPEFVEEFLEMHFIFVWESIESWKKVDDKDIQAALIARFESKFKHPYKLTRCIQNEENFGLHRYSRFERI